MQITFDREKLLNGVNLLKGITRTKSLIAVTRSVRIDIKSTMAQLTANDLEVAAITAVPCTCSVDTPNSFLMHAGTLAEVLANIKGNENTMDIPDLPDMGAAR